MKTVYFTICARNYLAYALTLRHSLLQQHPSATFYIFLADAEIDGDIPCENITSLDQLALSKLSDMTFRYTVMEFATAIKPYCFRYLFDELQFDAAIYLDPDIQIFGSLNKINQIFADGSEAVLTPHITKPLPEDGKNPTNEEIAMSGKFNFGFVALANTPDVGKFLNWWAARCSIDCFVEFSRGLFVDQKFGEDVPSFIEKTHILTDPGFNVAYWNLVQRPVTKSSDGQWIAVGDPLVFFHFSGVDPARPELFSKHQNRFSRNSSGVSELLDGYFAQLDRHGFEKWNKVPYAHARYQNGDFIPAAARRIYAADKAAGVTVTNPFAANYEELNKPTDNVPGAPTITRFMHQVWTMRSDLQSLYPLKSRLGREGFHRWFTEHAIAEGLAIPPLTPKSRRRAYGFAQRLKSWLRGDKKPRDPITIVNRSDNH